MKYLVKTPGGSTYACEKHKNALVHLFQDVLEAPVHVEPLEHGEEPPCDNCENEKQQKQGNDTERILR